MTPEEQQYDCIEKYLSGKLSPTEEELIRDKIQTDKEFAKEVQAHRLVQEFVVEHELPSVKAELKGIMRENTADSRRFPFNFQKIRAAASILLLIGTAVSIYFVFFRNSNSNAKLFADNFKPAVFNDMRSNDTLLNTASDTAFQFYKQRDYISASDYFAKAVRLDSLNPEVQFFYGNSLLAADRPEKARFYFEKLLESGKTGYTEEARWYLALTYLAEENTKIARQKLNEIINDPNNRDRKKAEKLLEKLE